MNSHSRRAVVAAVLASIALPLLPGPLLPGLRAQGTPVGFEEVFALAPDRTKILDQLLPGTVDFYYYRCLDAQHRGDFDAVRPMLEAWIERHGRSDRVDEIECRQTLLTYDRDPKNTFGFLRNRLGLRFDDQRTAPGARPDLPIALDPQLLARTALDQRAFANHPESVDGFRDGALADLAGSKLTDQQLTSLVRRLRMPDVPNLVPLLVRQLRQRGAGPFGSLPIHHGLLLDQYDELARQLPELLGSAVFVNEYASRLRPSADVDWRHDEAARAAYLDRLWAFAQRLPAAQNGFKVHVLYQRLVHDLAAGKLDKQRFLAYLALPRPSAYVAVRLREQWQHRGEIQALGQSYETDLPVVRGDDELVRRCLEPFFAQEDSYEPYRELIEEGWLRRAFAETRLLAGQGDAERLYSQLGDPGYYQQLEERVEIAFAPDQRTMFAAEDPVAIDVDVKNVPTLLLKVFAIDAYAYQRDNGREVDASIDLDGLVANQESTQKYSEPPLRRVRRRFELPELKGAGTWVVELLGNGTSSRAVISKGRLQYTQRLGAGGHVLTLRSETGAPLAGATAWFAGHEYAADDHGEVNLPYGEKEADLPLVLKHGNASTLVHLHHRAEHYALAAGIFVDREALLAGHAAKILVRPSLRLCGQPVALALLEDPELVIAAADQDGVPATTTQRALKLDPAQEYVAEIQVPEQLAKLTVTLRGHVTSMGRHLPVELSAPAAEFGLNRIDATPQTSAPLFGRGRDGWFVDVLGKNGEPQQDRAVTVRLVLRDYVDPFDVQLKTDAKGRVQLGELPGVAAVRLLGLSEEHGRALDLDGYWSAPELVTGIAGSTLRVPYVGRATTASRAVAALFEMAGEHPVRDWFDHLAIANGYLELRELPAGDYRLWLKEPDPAGGAFEPRAVRIAVTAGKADGGWALGHDRWLPHPGDTAPQITAFAVDGDHVRVHLANVGKDARVHVWATRYAESWSPERFDVPEAPLPDVVEVARSESDFRAGRELGDEYRYILDRRYQKKYPGNMLARPGLLLNPWALQETGDTVGGTPIGGGRFAGRGHYGSAPGAVKSSSRQGQGWAGAPGTFADLDFLPRSAPQIVNLAPDRDGTVNVTLAQLGQGQLVHVVAIDGEQTIYRTLVLPEAPLQPRPRQLQQGLDPAQDMAQQRRIEFVDAGGTAVIDNAAAAHTETFASLADVYRLFTALSHDADLAEFAFVLRWPELKDDERRELYSKHSCHELDFFLHQKDAAFFAAVIKPYLANKLHKTFLDHWLLDDDLVGYLEPWAFGRLNLFEQILLLQRLPGERENGARLLRERFELLPPEPERADRLFTAALQSGALERFAGRPGNDVAAAEPAESANDARAAANEKGGLAKGYEGKSEELAKKPAASPAGPASPGPARPATGGAAGRLAGGKDADKERARDDEQKDKKADGAADLLTGLDDAPASSLSALGAAHKVEEAEDLGRRRNVRELYRMPDPTRRYAENNYWHRMQDDQGAGMIPVNEFWRDYAVDPAGTPFRSTHFAAVTSCFAEMMLALAVLDLPFTAEAPRPQRDGNRLTMRPASPMLLVRQELLPAQPAAGQTEVLLSQNFYRLDDRYRIENGERLDRFVTGEFLVGVVYGCQVVLTNPTSTPRKLDLLLQIPVGALPVQSGFQTRGIPVHLDAYATTKIEFAFYFPAPGDFARYPAHVSKDGAVVAAASVQPPVLHVVAVPTEVDAGSWERVSQDATADEVLAFLGKANLQRLDLGRMLWRLHDRSFFERAVALLQGRHVYHDGVWSYAVLHGAEAQVVQWLRHADAFVQRCGSALQSKLLVIEPVERGRWQQIEFAPLFLSRAHQVGKRREILDRDLAAQYRALLDVLDHEPRLSAGDWLIATYYLLLQDRIDDALAAFARVDRNAVPTRMQYDYLACYLDFYTDDPGRARAIAQPYADHPVERWRHLFRSVLAQLDEAEGKAGPGGDLQNREARQGDLAASEPMLDFAVEGGKAIVRHKNLARCEVRYYRMDVEFSFSTNPFVQQGSGSFAWVKPQRTDALELKADAGETPFALPAEFQNQNVLVELRGGGLVRRQTAFATSLRLQTIESYGQLQVTDAASKKPLPKVYVKVYARLPGGAVRFHKDGYTDLRGRFDYASVTERTTAGAERFALLVLSEENGAVIREVTPPTQ